MSFSFLPINHGVYGAGKRSAFPHILCKAFRNYFVIESDFVLFTIKWIKKFVNFPWKRFEAAEDAMWVATFAPSSEIIKSWRFMKYARNVVEKFNWFPCCSFAHPLVKPCRVHKSINSITLTMLWWRSVSCVTLISIWHESRDMRRWNKHLLLIFTRKQW